MINWIRGWLERHRSRRIVPCESVEMNVPAWRKKKADEQYVKTMTDHHMAIVRIHMEAGRCELERLYAENKRFLREARRKAERNDAELRKLRDEHER